MHYPWWIKLLQVLWSPCKKGKHIVYTTTTRQWFWRYTRHVPDISARNISARNISARTFHHMETSAGVTFSSLDIPAYGHFVSMYISAQELFSTRNFSAQGYFGTMDVSTQGHYGTETFRHMNILVLWTFWHNSTFWYLIRNVCAEMSILLCKVPKFTYAESSICCNIPVP